MSEKHNKLVQDLWDIIDNDLYAWFCVWGPPRTGKSNLCLLLSYWIYEDWDTVMNSIVFNLNGLLYKLEKGEPRLFPTRNGLHMRVPLLFLDDFGAHCNKAKTQHERGWDMFKGGFDTLGTMLGVLMANMVSPNEATQQLSDKYTHELFVYQRGRCKYDKVHQQQDFRQWHSRQNKEWLLDFSFDKIPDKWFRQYDEMRVNLAKEVLFSINETISDTQMDFILKRLRPSDKDLVFLLDRRGPTYKNALVNELGKPVEDAVIRMKAKGVIVPKKVKGKHSRYYKYNLTELGYDVLSELKKIQDNESL